MFEYEVTYEMQSGEHRTCFLASRIRCSLIKVTQQADRLLRENEPGYKTLVGIKEHMHF